MEVFQSLRVSGDFTKSRVRVTTDQETLKDVFGTQVGCTVRLVKHASHLCGLYVPTHPWDWTYVVSDPLMTRPMWS